MQNNAFECIHRNVNKTTDYVNDMDGLYLEGFEKTHNLKEEARKCYKESSNPLGAAWCLSKVSTNDYYGSS